MYDTAVIIPHYNDVERLSRCLAALMPQVGEDMEVVVADNASSDSLEPVRKNWPSVRIVIQTEKGAGLARNAGVAATTAPWLIFLDADCVPSENWIAVARRIRRPGAIVGGIIDLFDETPPPRSGAEAFETAFAFQVERYLREDRFLVSAQLVLSRAVFEDVGGFKADVAEDNEWCHRALDKGYRLLLEPEFRVSHPTRSDWDALLRKWHRMVREMFLMYAHGPAGRLRYLGKAALMPLSIFAHAPRVLSHPDLSASDKVRGLGTLTRIRLTRMIWMVRQVLTGQA